MRTSHKTKNTQKKPAPGGRRTAAEARGSLVRRLRRAGHGPWLPALATAVFGLGLLVMVFAVVKRNAAKVSAPYIVTPAESTSPSAQESAASAPQETPDLTGPSFFRRLEWKPGQFVLVQYGPGNSTELDVSGFTDPSTKNSHDLAEWAKMAWANQWGYVWGSIGYILTEDQLSDKLEQYPDQLREYEDIIREKWMGRRVVDCVGLIKSYGWYDPATGGIEYGSGDMPDTGTDGMWQAAAVKGDMDTMPDEPGILVYSTAGHIGVYIGGGCAIEAISHAGGVVKTKVADRPWTGWLQCPYIRYDP